MLTFVGTPKGEHIYAHVYLKDELISPSSALMLTLNQWNTLRDLWLRSDEDSDLIVQTADEYEHVTGERVYV